MNLSSSQRCPRMSPPASVSGAHYTQLMKEPVPDDLLRILGALDRTGRAGDDR
jgi:hypothetical protein